MIALRDGHRDIRLMWHTMMDLVRYEAVPQTAAVHREIEMLKVLTMKHAASAATLVLLTACSSPKSTPSPAATPALWGEMKPIVSVKELMRDMLDPAADNIFDAVKVESTKNGTVERTPKTDADWEKIRIGAVTVAEGVYLLKVPRPFAPPGDKNNSTGPEATELSPAAIKAKLESDLVLWNAKIETLRNVGLEVLEIVKNKKTDELWEAGDNLDQACESCHIQYWYPGDKALLERVDRGLGLIRPAARDGRRPVH